MDLKELTERISQLEGKAVEAVEKMEAASASPEDKTAAQQEITRIDEQIKPLLEQHEKALREEEVKSMKAQVTTLTEAVEALREPTDFSFGGEEGKSVQTDAVYGSGEHSFYNDVMRANKGDVKAIERLEASVEGKAMTVGTSSAGGYLVPDQYSSDILELRFQAAVVESLFSRINVQSDTLRIASVTGGLTAGWVAELAEKPSADLTFGEISTSVFTVAGLAVASNQLLSYAGSDVDRLVNRELARRIARVVEVAIFNGSGTGQPKGIIGTSGVGATALTSTDVEDLLDAIFDSITDVYTDHIDAPNAIVMHPRTWGRIAKARTTAGEYLVGSPSTPFRDRAPQDAIPGYAQGQTPRGELFGLPVYTTANVPTNLGTGTDESRVIVGKFDEGLILDRGGVTVDKSEHVYFTSNQTVFRGEQDIGFTAARYPKAFSVVGGVGLAGG